MRKDYKYELGKVPIILSADKTSLSTNTTEIRVTLLSTAVWVMNCRMENQMPMSWARSTTGRRYSVTNFWASKRISIQLLMRAKRGARGHAATKMVMNPNWSTESSKNTFLYETECSRSQLCLQNNYHNGRSRDPSKLWKRLISSLQRKTSNVFGDGFNLPEGEP